MPVLQRALRASGTADTAVPGRAGGSRLPVARDRADDRATFASDGKAIGVSFIII